MEIEEIVERARDFLKTEHRADELYRLGPIIAQLGTVARFIYHDEKYNPFARSAGIREEEITGYGELMIHVMALCLSREIDIIDAFEAGFERLEDKDGYKKKGQIVETAVAKVIKGTPASPGIAQGTAIVMQFASEREFERLFTVLDDEEEIVLVTESLTPDSSSFLKAINLVGLVTNQGGHASHGAKIAKEAKIPCVSGTTIATKIIHLGDTIIVDGTKGEVVLRKQL